MNILYTTVFKITSRINNYDTFNTRVEILSVGVYLRDPGRVFDGGVNVVVQLLADVREEPAVLNAIDSHLVIHVVLLSQ